jgi:hypothetical protein
VTSGNSPAIRTSESKRAVGLALATVAFLVDGAVMAATEQGQVRERGGAAVGPVANMMALTERQPAAGKAAAAVSVVERAT